MINLKAEILNSSEFELPLKELATYKSICVSAGTSLSEALEVMRKNKIGSIAIEQDTSIIGIFTERDYLLKVLPVHNSLEGLVIDDFMTKNPISLSLEDSLLKGIELLTKKEFRHLPLHNDQNEITHIISIKDFLKHIRGKFLGTLDGLGTITSWDPVFVDKYSEDFSIESEANTLSSNVFFTPLSRICTDSKLPIIEGNPSVYDVINQMSENKFGSVLLVKFNTLLNGIFTERDVLNKITTKSELALPVSHFMTSNPHIILQKHYIGHALNNMFTYGYRNSIVVNEDKYPIGIVSLLDILKFLYRRIKSSNE